MAFDYYGTKYRATELREHATVLEAFKNTILSMQSSVRDSWKSAMVPQIDMLFGDVERKCNEVFAHLHNVAGYIDKAAEDIKNEEIAAQQQWEEQQRALQQAQQQAQQQIAEPVVVEEKAKPDTKTGKKTTKSKKSKGKKSSKKG